MNSGASVRTCLPSLPAEPSPGLCDPPSARVEVGAANINATCAKGYDPAGSVVSPLFLLFPTLPCGWGDLTRTWLSPNLSTLRDCPSRRYR